MKKRNTEEYRGYFETFPNLSFKKSQKESHCENLGENCQDYNHCTEIAQKLYRNCWLLAGVCPFYVKFFSGWGERRSE